MAWSASKVCAAAVSDILDRTANFDLDGNSFKLALYNNAITPSNTAAAASTAYNTGQWATANEVADGTEWDAAGEPITGNDVSIVSSTVVTFDATDTPSGGSSATLTCYGGLVYNDTLTTPVADQGLCYLYFGGVQTVTDGTLNVIYATAGIATIDVA
jgi:hypothetical protein